MLSNLVHFNDNNFPSNVELLKYAIKPMKGNKVIYPKLRLPEKSFTQPTSLQTQPDTKTMNGS